MSKRSLVIIKFGSREVAIFGIVNITSLIYLILFNIQI